VIQYQVKNVPLSKYLFFTGKGGVGKTSTACATAVNLADNGHSVLLISTDPASNLQDVFSRELHGNATEIEDVPNLSVVNLDPIEAAQEYKESVVAPYRGKLPQAVIANMEEQLSGSCTVEIAAFNTFSNFITDKAIEEKYDYIIFDTAPTGHTIRMLQLPSAWSNFISENTHGASCLGQLSGLQEKKEIYKNAISTLADGGKTTLMLVTRPELAPIKEAVKTSGELLELGMSNQILVVNGILEVHDDELSDLIYEKQQRAMELLPSKFTKYFIPLRSYNISGVDSIRNLLVSDSAQKSRTESISIAEHSLEDLVDSLNQEHKKVIFTMGKGGVGKTTIAAAIALRLHQKGIKVHLATTDPAAHIDNVLDAKMGIKTSHIDEKQVLEEYKEEVLSQARKTMSKEDLAYIEEDLRSPCTQEIAVFRAFANIVEKADYEVVVIDTAPTGHTLLLLDSTLSYHKEVQRTQGNIPDSVKKLLPRLRSSDTEVIIVTLPEATPVFEAMRLQEDLNRAGLKSEKWVINSSLYKANPSNLLLAAKAQNELPWIQKVDELTRGNFYTVALQNKDVKNEELLRL
jgi:arsenite-activated ATPase arsA